MQRTCYNEALASVQNNDRCRHFGRHRLPHSDPYLEDIMASLPSICRSRLHARRWLAASWLATCASWALPAQGGAYLTGSIAASTTNVPLQSAESQYASGSLELDLGRYVRIGYTHGQEMQISNGYKRRDPSTGLTASSTGPLDCVDPNNCLNTVSRTNIVENSIGLTLILYEGQIFMPFIMAGGIIKSYTFQTKENGSLATITGKEGPVPNLGGGIGIRLNRSFSLKISQQLSQGIMLRPGDSEPRGVWDRKTTLGLSYQI